MPFRRLDQQEQYSKFDWIECDLIKSNSDPRPESYHPADTKQLIPVGHIDTHDKWSERRKLLLESTRVFTTLDELIFAAKQNTHSLAVFRPSRIHDFIWEGDDRDWDLEKVEEMRERAKQGELFPEADAWKLTFELIPKLPYKFSYKFEDTSGRLSTLQVLDWEVGALYWNCLRDCDGDEQAALRKVRLKYFDEFVTRDLHFFLGTTQQFHFIAPNPWLIVGVFPIPKDDQLRLV